MYISMNGGRRPNQGRGTANQNEPGRGKHPHLSRRGVTIQITSMINIIHIPTARDGMCMYYVPRNLWYRYYSVLK